MSNQAQAGLDEFWELIDEIFNCILFLLIGFELLIVAKNNHYFLAALLAIPLTLLVRFMTVYIPISLFKAKRTYCPHMITILVWGGLRGGLAVALALALPFGEYRQVILAMTYAVVSFSIIIQGITIKPLVKFATKTARDLEPKPSATNNSPFEQVE
jgi:CPA1 family monovalent cation:H+ antiporter